MMVIRKAGGEMRFKPYGILIAAGGLMIASLLAWNQHRLAQTQHQIQELKARQQRELQQKQHEWPRPISPRSAGIFMAGMEIKLGMPEDSLVAKLQENYTVSEAAEHGRAIWEKRGSGYRMVGLLGFTDGKLSSVSKDWGSYDGDAVVDFAINLFSLLSSSGESGPAPVLVHSRVAVRQPGLVVSEIKLAYPERTISIIIDESRDRVNNVSISEVVEAK